MVYQTTLNITAKMKRMKYRVWDKENNCWYKPTYRAYRGELEDLTLTPTGQLIMRTLDQPAIHESRFLNRFEIVLFTGLKDKHGKEIYADDLYKTDGKIFIVEWDVCSFQITNIDNKDDQYYLHQKHYQTGEIIGNIYENPELL